MVKKLQPLIWEEREGKKKKVDLRVEMYKIEEHKKNKIERIHSHKNVQ
jgi:hypothetical protein